MEVLEWIVRYGLVSRDAVSVWAKTGRSVTLDRERRLREAGLIEVHPLLGAGSTVLLPTRRGLRLSGHTELRPAHFSLGAARHSIIVAHVAAHLERAGEALLSEREIIADERYMGERIHSARRSSVGYGHGGWHRPDLIRLGVGEEAIEVELTNKAPDRLDQLLKAWRSAIITGTVDGVIYLCPPETFENVWRGMTRTRTTQKIALLPLEVSDPVLPGPTRQPSGGSDEAVKGLRPDPLRGLTASPPPLPSRVGRG